MSYEDWMAGLPGGPALSDVQREELSEFKAALRDPSFGAEDEGVEPVESGDLEESVERFAPEVMSDEEFGAFLAARDRALEGGTTLGDREVPDDLLEHYARLTKQPEVERS